MKFIYLIFANIFLLNKIGTCVASSGIISYLKGTLVLQCGKDRLKQCMVVLVTIDPPTFIGSGLCVYHEGGNSTLVPENYRIKTPSASLTVTKIFLHPKFISTSQTYFKSAQYSTSYNIALFRVTMDEKTLERYRPNMLKLANDSYTPVNCTANFVRLPSIVQQTKLVAEFINRTRNCNQQMFSMAFLRDPDDLCASIPVKDFHSPIARHYTGAAITCVYKTEVTSFWTGDYTTERIKTAHNFLYAILTSTYNCGHKSTIAVFTKISSHLNFILDPEKYTRNEEIQFRRRAMRKKNISSHNFQRCEAVYLITLLLTHFTSTN